MEEILTTHSNDLFTDSKLVEKIQHAEEEITKGDAPYKTNKLTFITLNKKLMKQSTRFLLREYDDAISIYDIQVVLSDDKFIKYVQVNFLEENTDDDAKYKPYVRLYREKTFHTVKEKSKKTNDNGDHYLINVSTERTTLTDELAMFKTAIFKLIYKMIFNSNPKPAVAQDKFKRRIKFL